MDKNRFGQVSNSALKKTILWLAMMSSFLPPFMGSALNIALPAIGREFSLSAVAVSWINSVFLLTTAICLVPFGKIADIYGRKKIFFWGTNLYSVACLLCALAPSASSLIAARALLGAAAAMIFGTGTAILTSAFPAEERGKVLGINVAVVYLGLSSGPILGGLMTEYWGWRSIFLSNIPFALVVSGLVLAVLKGTEWADARGEKLDGRGTIVYCFALSLTMVGLSRLPNLSGIILFAVGALLMIMFIHFERTAPYPVLDIGLFTNNRIFVFSNLAALIHYSATFAVGFLLSIYFQIVKDFSPAKAGLILIVQPLMQAIFSPLAGKLSDRIEPRIIASSGMALTCTGLMALVLIQPETDILVLAAILGLLGFGFAFFSSPNTNSIMSSVEKKHYGVASGMLATMRQMGQMFSMTITMLAFTLIIGSAPLTRAYSAIFLVSMKIILIVLVVLCIAGIFASLARGNMRD